MKKPLVAPSIIAADFLHLAEEAAWLNNSAADFLHIDLMDGHFVPNISLGFPAMAALAQAVRLPFDVHMMLSAPEKYLKRCAALGAARISVHVEAAAAPQKTLEHIRALGCQAGVALNPNTSAEVLKDLWPFLDIVLLMSVHPGFAGQSFLPESVEKLRQVFALRKAAGSKAQIVVDGGIHLDNAPAVSEAGADVLVVGQALFSAQDRNAFLSALKGG